MIKEVSKNLSLNHTREEHIINTTAIHACDKPFRNKYVTSNLSMGMSMGDRTYTQMETKWNEIKVIMEFPEKSDEETTIRQEVEQLLSSILEEQAVQFM